MKLISFVYRWPLGFALLCIVAGLYAALGAEPTLVAVARLFLFFFAVLFIVSLLGRRNHPHQ
jgi:uncharacterized membrane protein YtjA (UPF0391 family)